MSRKGFESEFKQNVPVGSSGLLSAAALFLPFFVLEEAAVRESVEARRRHEAKEGRITDRRGKGRGTKRGGRGRDRATGLAGLYK